MANILYEEELRHRLGDAFQAWLNYAKQNEEEWVNPYNDLYSDLAYFSNIAHREREEWENRES